MENKYYKPEIEDLRIGYKCEVKEPSGWYTWILDYTDEITDIINWIPTDTVRTKYLDKEDIESLGWKYEMGYDHNEYHSFIFEDHTNLIWGEIGETITISHVTGYACYYQGPCPSINELKFLMKLLGIK